MATSLRSWLIFSFVTVLFICLTGIGLFFHAINQSKKFAELNNQLKTLRILLYDINSLKDEILSGDQNNNQFYTTRFSATEVRFAKLSRDIHQLNKKLRHSILISKYNMLDKSRELSVNLDHFTDSHEQLFALYKIKGFKNYGLEGDMREYAHRIFEFDNLRVQHFCLRLRRHEKDFLLRKDLTYVHQFNQVTSEFIAFLKTDPGLASQNTNALMRDLFFYHRCFMQLSRIESRIGIRGKSGLLNKVSLAFSQAGDTIGQLDAELQKHDMSHKQKLARDTVVVVILLIIVLVITMVVITRQISNSVKGVTGAFSNYIESGFKFEEAAFSRSRIKEFNLINTGFLKMARELNIFTNFFREKVNERTLEISQQKNEILAQRRHIEEQYHTLLRKNNQLSVRKKLLVAKNKDIRDSLLYAKRIQRAIQSGSSDLKNIFADSFVFTKAKDVVSGDFFLCFTNGEPGQEKKMLVAADCTGHGVPGAMMSVLGINTIHKHIKQSGRSEPGAILNLLDQDFNQLLAQGKKTDDIVADGMDISIFAFDEKEMILEYSVARFGHFILRNGEISTLSTRKVSIGHSFFDHTAKAFETNRVQVEKGDCLYLFSDGYADQFGGPDNKKFKRNNMKELIADIHPKSMAYQKLVFKETFNAWKGNNPQTDDVLVIGIRF